MRADGAFDPAAHRDLHGASQPLALAGSAEDEVTRLATQLLDQLDLLADAAVARVVADVPAYRSGDAVIREDLWWSCHRNIELILHLIAEDRAVTRDELRARQSVGTRRAEQGVPIDDVLRAFHVGCLALWEHLVDLGERLGPATTSRLLARAGRIWTHLNDVSTAVAAAHRREIARQQARAQQGPATLLRDLDGWPSNPAAARSARAVGFDPDGTFVAAIHPGAETIAWPRPSVALHQPGRTVQLCATEDADLECETALAERLAEAGARHVGVGMARQGLSGARATLRDAERAHVAARLLDRQQLSFRIDWFATLVVEHRADLQPIVGSACEMLRDDAEVRETLEAYLAARGRASGAASRLHVHPNTVTYRLDRLQRQAGIDPRCFDGALTARLLATLHGTDDPVVGDV